MTPRGSLPQHPLRLRLHLRNDRGIALPMVLMVFIVGVALISAFLVAIVGSSQVTATNKNIVQAQAAAEAGIAAAEARMRSVEVDPCTTDLAALAHDTAALRYDFVSDAPNCVPVGTGREVIITATGYSQGSVARVEARYTWVPGGTEPDPEAGGNSIVYTGGANGFATHPGLTLTTLDGSPIGVTTANAEFDCNGISLPGGLIGSAGAHFHPCIVNGDVHLAGTLRTNNNGSNLITGDVRLAGTGTHDLSGTMRGDVFTNGLVSLHNSGVIEGALTVTGSGETVINGRVKGDLIVADRARITGTVEGDVIAVGTGVTTVTGRVEGDIVTNGSVIVDWNSRVDGDITAARPGVTTTIRSQVNGDVTVGGSIDIAAWGLTVPGTLTAGESIRLAGSNAVGGTTPGCVVRSVTNSINWNSPPNGTNVSQRSCQIPASALTFQTLAVPDLVPAPVIEPWRDFAYDPADWVGFDPVTVTGNAACDTWTKNPGSAWGDLRNLTMNTVFDLRACGDVATNSNSSANSSVELSHNVAFVVDELNLHGMTFTSAGGAPRQLWLVQPGTSNDGDPVCSLGGNSRAINFEGTRILDPVHVLAYTPCGVRLSNTSITGNIYAGSVSVGGNSTVQFAPIGLPGWPTTGGGSPGGGTTITPALGSLLVQRNID